MWELDYAFKQTSLVVRRNGLPGNDTFCNALTVGWLTEKADQPFRSMHTDQLEGRNREVIRLHREQLALRDVGREGGLPVLLQSRGLSKHTEIDSDPNKAVPGRGYVVSDLANAVLQLKSATRILIEVQGSRGAHAFGVRRKPTKMEFFDPNYGVYYGDAGSFALFLAEHLQGHYGTGFRGAFSVTSLVSG